MWAALSVWHNICHTTPWSVCALTAAVISMCEGLDPLISQPAEEPGGREAWLGQSGRVIPRYVLLVAFAGLQLVFCQPLLALDPKRAVTQYGHAAWRAEDGLPQNTVQAIVQTRDGYLWIGTEEGLVRFDGVRFAIFDMKNTGAIRSNFITSLREDEFGNLWIGTRGGLTKMKDGQFTTYPKANGLPSDIIRSIYEARDGSLWIGTSGGGLARLLNGEFTTYSTEQGLLHNSVWS